MTKSELITCKKVIKEHYNLNRQVTDHEVKQEILNLKRKGVEYLMDSQLSLHSALCNALHVNSLKEI